jgi:hypothetical protein
MTKTHSKKSSTSTSKRSALRANFVPAYHRTDPDLAQVVMILNNSPEKKRAIQDSKGVTTQTLNNWVSGRTKRPYNVTLTFVMEGLGYRRKWEKE